MVASVSRATRQPAYRHGGLALALALASIIAALGFQYIGGLAPCHLCWLQRYPHMAAVAIGALLLVLRWRLLSWAGAAVGSL